MKRIYVVLIFFNFSLSSQINTLQEQIISLENDSQFSNFFKNPVTILPSHGKSISMVGQINFSEMEGRVIIKPTDFDRIIIKSIVQNTMQKMFAVPLAIDSLGVSKTIIRKGNAQTSEGEKQELVLSVYPVPSSTNVNINLRMSNASFVKCTIHDLYGHIVSEFDFNDMLTSNYVIDISSLKKCAYFLEVLYKCPEPSDPNRIVREIRTILIN